MSSTQNLLVELLVEEMPPKALKKLGEAFANGVADVLAAASLHDRSVSVLTSYASPRRLAVHLTAVRAKAEDRAVSQKLMPVSVGLTPQGEATPALLKKLASLDADASVVPRLQRRMDGKAEVLFHDSIAPGLSLNEGLQRAVDDAIAKLPIPKVMSYQLADGWSTVNFVRPVHGVVALHGADVVPLRLFGVEAGRQTQGHRFEALRHPVVLRDADSYAAQLRDEGAVIASFAERKNDIVNQLQVKARQEGLRPIDDTALLDEVTALVERPNVLTCRFEEDFLAVPQECLILTMKANQKYFPLLDAKGALTNRFLIVSNITPDDPGRVIEGNERVVRPRLADAKFFFEQDRKRPLVSRVAALDKVVYHNKLGSQGERVRRVRSIAKAIALQLAGEALAVQADRAAELAKADLVSDMVGEFPELQGTMGRYYAQHDGEPEEIALAIEDHYRPRFAGDELPRGDIGIVVAMADKLETLAGLFSIGQHPTGDKDPFALRRHALGVIRMLIERALPLEVPMLVSQAFAAFSVAHGQAHVDVTQFLYERLVGYLRELGYSALEVDAVIALRSTSWADLPRRLAAVRVFAALPEAASLASANKRVGNILKKSDAAAATGALVDSALLNEPAEQALHEAIASVMPRADAAFAQGDFTDSLQALAALKAPVDAFFDAVMVNADDPALRANRLALLSQLHATMNRVADLAKLAV